MFNEKLETAGILLEGMRQQVHLGRLSQHSEASSLSPGPRRIWSRNRERAWTQRRRCKTIFLLHKLHKQLLTLTSQHDKLQNVLDAHVFPFLGKPGGWKISHSGPFLLSETASHCCHPKALLHYVDFNRPVPTENSGAVEKVWNVSTQGGPTLQTSCEAVQDPEIETASDLALIV